MKNHFGFIPPFILDNVAKSGVEDAKLSIIQSAQSRNKRSAKVVDVATLAASAAPTTTVTQPPENVAARKVYDCQHKWQLRVKLVRSDGDPITNDQSVTNAYDFAGKTREFYKEELGRNSIDNLGMNLILNVNYGTNYMNAFWDGDEMTFGNGDGKIFTDFTNSLDVIAHELTHGITQYTANLVYKGQSGALNEHFSDVLGTVITQHAENQKAKDADWLIGDEIMGPELYGEALRSMKAPGTAYDNDLLGKDPQPDNMKDYYAGSGDNYGVHINSGIPNKAFYLVSMEIETDKAAQIWFHALQNLWVNAQFNDAVKVITASARLLVKQKLVPKGSTQVVRSAFKQVGLPTP